MPSPEQWTVFETSGALVGLFESELAVTNGDTDFGSRLVVTASEDRDSTRGLFMVVGGLGAGRDVSRATEGGDLEWGDCGRTSLPNSSFPESFSVLEEMLPCKLSCRCEGDANRVLCENLELLFPPYLLGGLLDRLRPPLRGLRSFSEVLYESRSRLSHLCVRLSPRPRLRWPPLYFPLILSGSKWGLWPISFSGLRNRLYLCSFLAILWSSSRCDDGGECELPLTPEDEGNFCTFTGSGRGKVCETDGTEAAVCANCCNTASWVASNWGDAPTFVINCLDISKM